MIQRLLRKLALPSHHAPLVQDLVFRFVAIRETATKHRRAKQYAQKSGEHKLLKQKLQDLESDRVCVACGERSPNKVWSNTVVCNRCRGALCNKCADEGGLLHECICTFDRESKEPKLVTAPTTTAFTSIVAASISIQNSAVVPDRLLCTTVEESEKYTLSKSNLRKWRNEISKTCGIQIGTVADKVTALAVQYLAHFPGAEDESEARDIKLLVHHLLSMSDDSVIPMDHYTVQDVDGRLQHLLLNLRADEKEKKDIGKPNLHGHTAPMVAAVVVYLRLRLRLRSKKDKEVDIPRLTERAGVGLQSFQACKSKLVQFI